MNELMIADRKEVDKLSMTIRELMPGGLKLTVVEAQSLAQVALLHGLDPFNGEVWYLKYDDGRSIGIMAGIKGHRFWSGVIRYLARLVFALVLSGVRLRRILPCLPKKL